MWSDYSLEVVDAVARNGSFSGAAQELHRVPSAISYTVRQLEEWLAVPLFERRHRDVELTPAGAWFLKEGRSVIKKMQITREQCQQIANGWRGHLSIAVDNIVKPERTRQMIVDFYRHFSDVELRVSQEVFNGVWDALADGRAEMAIGATQAIPVGDALPFATWACSAGNVWWQTIIRWRPWTGRSATKRSVTGPRWCWKIPRVRCPNALPGCWITSDGWLRRTGNPQQHASAQGCALPWSLAILHGPESTPVNGLN